MSTEPSGISFISSRQSPCINLVITITPYKVGRCDLPREPPEAPSRIRLLFPGHLDRRCRKRSGGHHGGLTHEPGHRGGRCCHSTEQTGSVNSTLAERSVITGKLHSDQVTADA